MQLIQETWSRFKVASKSVVELPGKPQLALSLFLGEAIQTLQKWQREVCEKRQSAVTIPTSLWMCVMAFLGKKVALASCVGVSKSWHSHLASLKKQSLVPSGLELVEEISLTISDGMNDVWVYTNAMGAWIYASLIKIRGFHATTFPRNDYLRWYDWSGSSAVSYESRCVEWFTCPAGRKDGAARTIFSFPSFSSSTKSTVIDFGDAQKPTRILMHCYGQPADAKLKSGFLYDLSLENKELVIHSQQTLLPLYCFPLHTRFEDFCIIGRWLCFVAPLQMICSLPLKGDSCIFYKHQDGQLYVANYTKFAPRGTIAIWRVEPSQKLFWHCFSYILESTIRDIVIYKQLLYVLLAKGKIRVYRIF